LKFLDCPIRLDGGLVLRLGGFTFGRNQQKQQGREVGAEHVDVLLVTLISCTSDWSLSLEKAILCKAIMSDV
jgi:hypothetical protein